MAFSGDGKRWWHVPPKIATANRWCCSLCFLALFTALEGRFAPAGACACFPAHKAPPSPAPAPADKGGRNARCPFVERRATMGWQWGGVPRSDFNDAGPVAGFAVAILDRRQVLVGDVSACGLADDSQSPLRQCVPVVLAA